MSSGLRFHFPGFLEAEPGAPPARKPEPQPKPAQAWEADLEELSSDEGSDEGGGAAVAAEPGPAFGQQEHPLRREAEVAGAASPAEAAGSRRTAGATPALLSLPDAVLALVFRQLHFRDVAALLAVSHTTRQLAASEAVWETVYERHRTELLRLPCGEAAPSPGAAAAAPVAGAQRLSYSSARSRAGQLRALEAELSGLGGALPGPADGAEAGPHEHGAASRSLALARSMAAASAVGVAFHGLRQAHDQVRAVLSAHWTDPDNVSVDNIRRLMMKLTRYSWSLAYECMVAGFVHCGDCVAAGLAMHLRAAAPGGAGRAVAPSAAPACACATCSSWASLSLPGALALWEALLAAWTAYRRWLVGVLSFCPALNDLVSAERAAEYMARGERLDTPTLFERGKAAFRSQVMVRFELRPALQTALALLYAARREDAQAGGTLIDAWRLLLELNVPDDMTESEARHTQEAFLEAYGMTTSSFRDINRGKLNIPAPR
eukprot:jgi/Tetstr1/454719/TSEL_041605.t1